MHELMKMLIESDWYRALPDEVQDAVLKYPPFSIFKLEDGTTVYIVSYTEGENGTWTGFRMSEIDPVYCESYDEHNSFYVCKDCLKEGKIRSCGH